MTTTPNLNITELEQNQQNAYITVNAAIQALETFSNRVLVIDRDLATAPGAPSDGDAYIVGGTGGDWSAFTIGEIAYYFNGWINVTPKEGWRAYLQDENIDVTYDGSAWQDGTASDFTVNGVLAIVGSNSHLDLSRTGGITASTTQTQGQTPLVSSVNEVSTVANANDVVTLPAAENGRICLVANRGANTLQIFPASGEAIDELSANASTTLATNDRMILFAVSGTRWMTGTVS